MADAVAALRRPDPLRQGLGARGRCAAPGKQLADGKDVGLHVLELGRNHVGPTDLRRLELLIDQGHEGRRSGGLAVLPFHAHAQADNVGPRLLRIQELRFASSKRLLCRGGVLLCEHALRVVLCHRLPPLPDRDPSNPLGSLPHRTPTVVAQGAPALRFSLGVPSCTKKAVRQDECHSCLMSSVLSGRSFCPIT